MALMILIILIFTWSSRVVTASPRVSWLRLYLTGVQPGIRILVIFLIWRYTADFTITKLYICTKMITYLCKIQDNCCGKVNVR